MNTGQMNFTLGMDGFIWFVGIVESIADPLSLGRAKVRIFGWHNKDRHVLPTYDLPWSYPMNPITNATGIANYHEGDWVVGWMFDGNVGQQPIIFGVLPAIVQPNSTT